MKFFIAVITLVVVLTATTPVQPTSAAVSKQTKIVQEAKKTIGVKYKTGGTTTKGFDCSGLTQYVYKKAVNNKLPRTSQQQAQVKAKKIAVSKVKAGDLLFYGSEKAAYHVAVCIGNGQMIHAPKPGDKVKVTAIKYYKPTFAKRVVK
ncbi:C40 family peptidase [Brochothrix campestris]|uniref:NlpC/P60 family protein n=1 Tax=Brochothrix campestris FSL F6-1037 TaxID=1265861 RepID=W7CCD1_9LIST|nr:C40 family peptidase [Brochothrix campestris]EUJ36999.1 nlpC/P60 family protein [Brochothrix campestris FSL F6-1037]